MSVLYVGGSENTAALLLRSLVVGVSGGEGDASDQVASDTDATLDKADDILILLLACEARDNLGSTPGRVLGGSGLEGKSVKTSSTGVTSAFPFTN